MNTSFKSSPIVYIVIVLSWFLFMSYLCCRPKTPYTAGKGLKEGTGKTDTIIYGDGDTGYIYQDRGYNTPTIVVDTTPLNENYFYIDSAVVMHDDGTTDTTWVKVNKNIK